MKPIKWRFIFVLALTLWASYSITPTITYFSQPNEIRNNPEEFAKLIPNWLPQRHVKLGLDLVGGVQLNLGVDTADSLENNLNQKAVDVVRWAEAAEHPLETAYVQKGTSQMTVVLPEDSDFGLFNEKFREEYPRLEKKGRDGNTLYYGYASTELEKVKKAALEQAERKSTVECHPENMINHCILP